MTPSNYAFDLLAVPLDQALTIAFAGAPGGKAECWIDEPPTDAREAAERPLARPHLRRLVLAWNASSSSTKDWHPFPAPVGVETAVAFVRDWLGALPREAAGRCPDIDGDVERSWRIYNTSPDMWSSAFVAIELAWAEYHK